MILGVALASGVPDVTLGLRSTVGDLYGPFLVILVTAVGLAVFFVVTALMVLVSFLGAMAIARLAVTRSLLQALNLVGIVRDIRRGFKDYLLSHLILMLPAVGLNVALLLMGINLLLMPVLALPLLSLVWQPLGLYVGLVAANLFGQYYQAYCLPQGATPRV